MRIGTTPLSKLYYGHDLIWKREDEETDSGILIITTTYTNWFQIPSINTTGVSGTADMGDGKVWGYNNYTIYYEYNYRNNWVIKIDAPFTAIKDEAFTGDYTRDLIKEIVIPKGVTSIGVTAFFECENLENVTLPSTLESIGEGAFQQCTNLTSVIIPDSVTSIGRRAFWRCSSLTSVIIPDSVTSIGTGMFGNCTSLTSVTIPDSVTSIGATMFSNCTSLTSVTIPDSVTRIGNSAFYYCTSLTSIIIPKSVTQIEMSAFANTGLTSVTIAKNCTYDSRPPHAGSGASFPPGCVVNRYPD